MRNPKAALGLTAMAIAVAGCGHASATRSQLSLKDVPLARGVQILDQARQCDRGANPFCALELLVIDRALRSSGDLVTREGRALGRAGWTTVPGDAGNERGANSPGQKLRMSYGTALADLVGSGAGWFRRSPALALSLSRSVLARLPAIAITVQTGPA